MQQSHTNGDGPEIRNMRRTRYFFQRNWRLIIGASILCGALVVFVLSFLTPRFTATAQVLVEARKEKIFGTNNYVSDTSGEAAAFESKIYVVQSNEVLKSVIRAQDLLNDTEFGPLAPPSFLSNLRARLLGQTAPSALDDDAVKLERTIQLLRDAMDVQRVKNSFVIGISVKARDPRKAASLANSIAETYIADVAEGRKSAARRASEWFHERMDTLRGEVKQSEDALVHFQRDNNLAPSIGAGNSANNIGLKLREFERLNVMNKAYFENYIARARQIEEQTSLFEREVRLITPAATPDQPSFPKTGLFISLAVIGGAILGVGLALTFELVQDGFLDPAELEKQLGLSILGELPIIPKGVRKVGGKVIDIPHYVFERPLSRFAEIIRAIRLAADNNRLPSSPNVILVTSSFAGEGRTTIAKSLAFSAQRAGQRVLLVDCNSRTAGATNKQRGNAPKGLADVLSGSATLDDCAMSDGGLTILPPGATNQSAPDIICSLNMKDFLDAERQNYDRIILDSPPIGALAETKLLASFADKVIFVVRWRKTPRDAARRGTQLLGMEHASIGVVLNFVNEVIVRQYGFFAPYSGRQYRQYYSQ